MLDQAIKTAISIDKETYDEAENLAQEMKVLRSKLFVIAMKEFIEHRKNKTLLEQINATYALEPTAEERALRKSSRQQHKCIVAREW